MRKCFFFLFVMVLSFQAAAQRGQSDTTGYKQYTGARSFEVQFAPLGGTPVSIGGLRFRSFSSPQSAWRLNAFMGITTDRDNTEVTDGNGDEVILKDVNSSFTIDFRPGMELHLPGTDRLSPYYGGEGIIGFRSTRQKVETLDDDGTTIVLNKTKNPGNDGYFRLGANAFLGADFYLARNVYLGTEVAFGLHLDIQHDEVFVPDDGEETVNGIGGTHFQFGPNVMGQLRLGFLF